MASNPVRVQGFTLFLGDLFTQLKTSNGQPLDPLHEAICRLLETLMMDPTNEENLKCVVKTLKVSYFGDFDLLLIQVDFSLN